jgi:hypothetical protein
MNTELRSSIAVAAVCLAAGLLIAACASLTPGADPLVVRVEQGESGASATFDLVLHEDNANRPFWKTNAPGFHAFCEWLRTPTPYGGSNVARCVAIELNVDDLKVAYKASKTAGNSNALYTAFGTLDAAISQAASWENIATNSIHP